MTSSQQTQRADRPRGSRRFIWLVVAIIAAIAVYTGAWYWAADKLHSETMGALSDARARGQEADCTNVAVRGYPFRLGLFCDGVAFSDPAYGLSLSGKGLRSAAQVYQPTRIVGELDTLGMTLNSPSGVAARSSVEDVRFSTRLARPLPSLTSVETGRINLTDLDDNQIGVAQSGQLHLRTNGGDLDIATSLTALTLTAAPELTPLSIETDGTLVDGIALLQRGAKSLRGTTLRMRNIVINAADSGLTMSGEGSVDSNGLVDGNFSVSIRNPPAVAAHLATALPELAPRISQVQGVLSAMGDNPTIPISIAKGQISISFFKIGSLPALN